MALNIGCAVTKIFGTDKSFRDGAMKECFDAQQSVIKQRTNLMSSKTSICCWNRTANVSLNRCH